MIVDLQGDRSIEITRRFRAPPELVYRAHTEPDLLRRWLGGTMGYDAQCACDVRPGGTFRYEFRNAETGHDFAIAGEYLEIEPGRRIVHVERMFLPDPTPDSHIETVFAAAGDGTLMTMTMTSPDPETRTAMLETGMIEGMEQTYIRLDGLDLGDA